MSCWSRGVFWPLRKRSQPGAIWMLDILKVLAALGFGYLLGSLNTP